MHQCLDSKGTKLMVVDDLVPEDLAMLQALYSRSAESAEVHLEKVKESGSGKFMERFYVNYGHRSIADCGSTTMFIENVSLLAAKAIQDWPLYSGQETSTRYIDMAKQPIVDPINTEASQAILQNWMDFYRKGQEPVAATIRVRYPRKPDEDETVYERAVKARTFDSMRGFLPAGIATQLSWHTNLRQAGDHLVGLSLHPLPEVRHIAAGLKRLLHAAYPSSGFLQTLSAVSGEAAVRDAAAIEKRDAWNQEVALQHYLIASKTDDHIYVDSMIDRGCMGLDPDLLVKRPRGCVLPHELSAAGYIHASFSLDFGSFRDIQRHRNGVCLMPLLTMRHGFEEWYLEQLGSLREEAEALIERQRADLDALTLDPVLRQYYTAIGFKVPCHVSYGLPAAVYVMELRSGKMIHPTLRKRIHQMITRFRQLHPDITLHVDMDPDDWDVRRGMQTIEEKKL